MKKIIAYTFVAVLLGVVTMLSPFALLSEMDTQGGWSYPLEPERMQTASSETEQLRGILPATYSPDVLFIAFMLTLSFVTALGVMRYFTRKTIL